MDDLDNVFKENLDYYREQEKIIAGLLISLPKGRIKKKKINGETYYYLQYRKGKKVIDEYLGKNYPKKISEQLERRKELENELKKVRKAIKLLTKKSEKDIDLIEPAGEIIKKFSEENMWEEGIEIVGSWCFLIYQKYLDFPKYPLKTEDLDILIPFPYKGKAFNIASFLRSLGFRENFNPDGSVYYTMANFKVEFLAPDKRSLRKKQKKYIKELGVSPQLLNYLDILLKHPMTLRISRDIRVRVPSPSGFFVHKLLIAKKRREKGKREKDIKQAVYTGKYILLYEKEKLKEIFNSLSEKRKKSIIKILEESKKYLPVENTTIEALIGLLL